MLLWRERERGGDKGGCIYIYILSRAGSGLPGGPRTFNRGRPSKRSASENEFIFRGRPLRRPITVH